MQRGYWIALGIGAVAAVAFGIKKAMGYVGGQPVEIELASIGHGLYLERRAATAFAAMSGAAAAVGIYLTPSGPRAAFRSMEDQQALEEELGNISSGGLAATPGYGPHQRGVAVDLNGFNPSAANYNPKQDSWMKANAQRWGFRQSTKEPWHWEFRA